MSYPLHKLAERIEMSFDIPDAEKQTAEEAKEYFESVVTALNFTTQHLNIIYEPFTNNSEIPTDSVIKYRGLLTRFSQKVKDNYKEVQTRALKAVQKLDSFSTGDSDIQEIISSFVEGTDNLSEKFSKLLTLLQKNYRSSSFRDNLLSLIDSIKEDAKDLETLIYDRVIEQIDTNILAKDWREDTSKALDMQIENEDSAPLIQRLFEERQEKLQSTFPGSKENSQAMNPSDAQKINYPNAITTMPGSLGGQS